MNNPSRVTIRETYTLPSRGKFPGVPERITWRAMSLMDEKQRLASQGISGIVDLIGNCTVEPEGFDPYCLSRFDCDFAMMKLRIVSHGPMYNVEVRCPHCGKLIKEAINLDELPVKEVEDDFSPVFEMGPLPTSGDILKVKMLVMGDLRDIDEEARRVSAKFPDYPGNPADVLSYIYKIQEVNGEKLPFTRLKTYVENMPVSDSVYFDQAYEEAYSDYGVDTQLAFVCDNCRQSFTKFMPLNEEFFRPKYNTQKR